MSHFPPVKVGLVGCGAVAQLYYAPALKQLEKQGILQVKSLYDPIPRNLDRVKQGFPHAAAAAHLAEFASLGLDLGIVASPPEHHARQSIQLLQAGLAVLCEKPLALSSAEGEAMLLASRETGNLLAVGLNRRFFPAAQAIRQILQGGRLGEAISFSCFEGGVFQWPVQSAAYFENYGVLMDIGTHVLDLLIWWWGTPVTIDYQDDAMGGVEVNCRLKLRFEPGFTGEVRLSRDWPRPNRYTIECRHGWIGWEVNQADSIQVKFKETGFALDGRLQPGDRLPLADGNNPWQAGLEELPANFEQSFTRQLLNVAAAIRGEEPLFVPAEQGLSSLRLIEACYRQRKLMELPWLSEREYERGQAFTSRSGNW